MVTLMTNHTDYSDTYRAGQLVTIRTNNGGELTGTLTGDLHKQPPSFLYGGFISIAEQRSGRTVGIEGYRICSITEGGRS